tara:strand:- start:1383 stop:2075 length:693 start_codon:yes stop_codon:yes gene_type:complete
MNENDLQDTQSFLRGSKKEKQALFLEYLAKFDKDIGFKKTHFKRFLLPEEVDSDAIFAIEEMFLEVDKIVARAERRAEQSVKDFKARISLSTIFNKHLMKEARDNKLENQPLTHAIKIAFKGSNKTKVFKGYELTFPVDVPEDIADPNYPLHAEEEMTHVKELMATLAPDKDSDVYKDLWDYFVERMTFQAIGSLPRNNGVSKQGVQDRVRRYIKKIKKRLNMERKYGIQ